MDADTNSETALMQSIKTQWGGTIVAACASSSVPPAFVAALIAGESGGDTNAKRFEPGVLARLWEVLLGRKAAFGSIGRTDLVLYVTNLGALTAVRTPGDLPADAFQRVDALATSWGLTQIMGYHAIEFHSTVASLTLPLVHLSTALNLLTQFAHRFQLDVTKDFEELFRCWNTGEPDGKTFDPAYVNNGLTRMAVWTSLP
jgi:hypothetical protein